MVEPYNLIWFRSLRFYLKLNTGDILKKSQPNEREIKDGTLVLILAACSFCIVLIHFTYVNIVPTLHTIAEPFKRNWGFHFISYFPKGSIIFFYVLAVLLCIPFFNQNLVYVVKSIFSENEIGWMRKNKYRVFIAFDICSFFFFYIFRFKYGLLGDNFLRVGNIVKKSILPDEFGTIYILHFFYRAVHWATGIGGLESLQLFTNIAGSLFIIFALLISDELGKSFFEKATLFLFYVAFPTITHFCGYVEIYSLSIVLIIAYFYFSVRVFKGKSTLVIPFILLCTAILCHLISIICVPSFIYLVYTVWLKKLAIFRKPLSWLIGAGVIGIIVIVVYLRFLYPRLYPIVNMHDGRMTMFSLQHFWEFLNGQILACGPALFMGTAMLLMMLYRQKKILLAKENLFFLITSIFSFCFLFSYNEILGSADWDIYSYASLSFNMLTMMLFFAFFKKGKFDIARSDPYS